MATETHKVIYGLCDEETGRQLDTGAPSEYSTPAVFIRSGTISAPTMQRDALDEKNVDQKRLQLLSFSLVAEREQLGYRENNFSRSKIFSNF